MATFTPCYQKLLPNGVLHDRAAQALEHLQACDLCANYCHVDRRRGATGVCRTGRNALVYNYGPHHGEERPLVGFRGSGTIFFACCNLHCVFCQNWELSQQDEGRQVTAEQLADMMLDLQGQGCHNINLVSSSHVVAQILEAIMIAAGKGLQVPLVYNSGGYDSPQGLALLDGIVDIYMPDIKFSDSAVAEKYLRVKNYSAVCCAAVREMYRQVGDLQLGDVGIAQRGLLVRHLVLPESLAGSEQIIEFIAREISTETYLNLMDQYRPCYRAAEYTLLNRRPSGKELRTIRMLAKRLGLRRLDRY